MFGTEQDVLLYYMKYVKQVSSGVTRRTYRSDDDGKLKYFNLAFVHGGKSKSTSNIAMPKPTKKMENQLQINLVQIPVAISIQPSTYKHNNKIK